MTVTGDAGHCCAATAAEIYRAGGDYILQVKGNQPTLLKLCRTAFDAAPRPPPAVEKLHGRLTERAATAVPATPAATGIPFCRSLVRVECATTRKGVTVRDTRYYASCLELWRLPPDEIVAKIRLHWKSCEIANHWIRDSFFREDDCRSRSPRVILNLALLINAAAFAVNTVRSAKGLPVPVQMENYARHPAKAVALVMGSLKMKEG